jgi:O-antigen ligase
LDTTEQTRLAQPVLPSRPASAWSDIAAESVPTFGQVLRLMAAILTFVAVFAFAARFEHPLQTPQAGPLGDFLGVSVPVAAALVAAFALYRPWRALLLVLALTPFWNAAYIAWQVGAVQVILQTVFVVALVVGAATTRPAGGGFVTTAADLSLAGRFRSFAAFRLAAVAVAGFVGIAVISTLASHDVTLSATVLLHGILEPIALASILVYLRPSRRDLVMLGLALGVSVGLGTVLNVIAALPTMTSLAAIQAHRLLFARASFYNVGLFAAVIAVTVPLVAAALTLRRSLGLPRWATVAIVMTLAVALAGLFFSLSKSAWIATGGGTILVLLFIMRSWRRRLALVVAGVAVSTLLIPWPALVLQVSPTLNSGYRSVMVALVGESRFDSWNPATMAGRGSLTERFYAVDGAVGMALANPVLGVGLDQFGVNYVSTVYRPPQAEDLVDNAHSFFPEIGAELGLPAASLVFVIYAAALWAMWRAYLRARDQFTRVLAAGLFASMISWLVVATAFGCYFYRPYLDQSSDVVVAAVVVGAAMALTRAVHSERSQQPAHMAPSGSR